MGVRAGAGAVLRMVSATSPDAFRSVVRMRELLSDGFVSGTQQGNAVRSAPARRTENFRAWIALLTPRVRPRGARRSVCSPALGSLDPGGQFLRRFQELRPRIR